MTVENYAKVYPLIYEVFQGGLIRPDDITDPDTSRFMPTKRGTSIADQIASLIVVNLRQGVNIAPLLLEGNVRIYPSNSCLRIISTEMEGEPIGIDRYAEAYAAGAVLYVQLLEHSVGSKLIRKELPDHLNEFIKYMENAEPKDLRLITNHSATFTSQVRSVFRLQAELVISDILPVKEPKKASNLLGKMPYFDQKVTHIQDKHPAFASWLAQGKKFTPNTWTKVECGRTVVKVNRHGTVHSFGPYLKRAVQTICTPSATDFLLTYKMPKYPSAVVNGCIEEGVFDYLQMGRLRPEKAKYYNFTIQEGII